jgi:hypothetical protein
MSGWTAQRCPRGADSHSATDPECRAARRPACAGGGSEIPPPGGTESCCAAAAAQPGVLGRRLRSLERAGFQRGGAACREKQRRFGKPDPGQRRSDSEEPLTGNSCSSCVRARVRVCACARAPTCVRVCVCVCVCVRVYVCVWISFSAQPGGSGQPPGIRLAVLPPPPRRAPSSGRRKQRRAAARAAQRLWRAGAVAGSGVPCRFARAHVRVRDYC